MKLIGLVVTLAASLALAWVVLHGWTLLMEALDEYLGEGLDKEIDEWLQDEDWGLND